VPRVRRRLASRPVTLLVLMTLFVCVVEAGTRQVIVRISRTERRLTREYAEALTAGHNGRPSVLLVGNSLLFEDVQENHLRTALAPGIDSYTVAVVETMYYDWYYGLKNLLGQGAKPKLVGLVMARWHLTSDFFRGSYSAFRLVNAADVLELSRDLKLHPTQTSGYLFANVSAFYGLRTEVRGTVLNAVVPGVDRLAPVFSGVAPFVETRQQQESIDVYPIAVDRLRRLKTLAESHGAQFVLILPPMSPERTAHAHKNDAVERAAAVAGVQILESESATPYTSEAFRDGLHMNESGATRYTQELAETLRQVIGEQH
jgi:hypothetical protein